MRNKMIIVRLVILFSFAVLSSAHAQDMSFNYLTTDNGLSQFTVYALYNDEWGQIWIGTRDGLNVYNGNRIKTYKEEKGNPKTLLGRTVRRICGNGKGGIYVLTMSGVSKFDMKTDTFTHIADRQKDWITAITYCNGKLYLGTYGKLFERDEATGVQVPYCTFPGQVLPNCLLKDVSGRCWIGSYNDGLYVMNPEGKEEKHLFPGTYIYNLYQDSGGDVWVCMWDNGLYRISANGQTTHYRREAGSMNCISDNSIRDICEDEQGNFWIGTERGLDKLDKRTGIFAHYTTADAPGSLSDSSVFSILKDHQGTFWIGTYFGGVNYFNPDYKIYTHYKVSKNEREGLSSPIVGTIIEGEDGQLWIATEGGGVNLYDRRTKEFKWYRHIEGMNSLSQNKVKCLYYDRQRNALWIGTHQGGFNKLDLRTGRFSPYTVNKGEHTSDVVLSIVAYQDKLIIASYDGVYLFHPETASFTLLTDVLAHYLKIDSKGTLWIAVEGKGVYCYNMLTQESALHSFDLNKKNSISDNMVTCITEDRNQRIWLSTMGGGLNLYHPETNDFERFTAKQDGLGSDCVYSVCESQNGRLLLTTNQGFCLFDPVSRMFSNYNHANGFPFTTLNEGSLCQTGDGEIFLGGMNGMVSFYEKQLNIVYKHYRIIPDRLLANGNEVHVGDDTGILPVSLYDASSIVLKSNHSIFSFEFAASNYLPANKDEIVYKLDGFSKDWTSTRGQNVITYTNLPAGDYSLLIRSVGKNKAYQAEYRLDIRVLPPFYKTTWAYLIYIVIVGGLLYYVVRTYQTRFHLRESLKYEQQHIRDVEEMNQSKLRFFTNISHEFRTPLTIIIGQMETLLQMQAFAPSIYNKLLNVYKNGVQLRELISELLDFRKQEQGHMKIKAGKHNLIDFLYENYLLYAEYAATRRIDFRFIKEAEELEVWYDARQIQKIISNLLSNAFKYTPQSGTIVIRVCRNADEAVVEVRNSGKGIEPEELEKIFTRFYQVEKSSTVSEGTGIGLALSKGLAELHHGTLTASSIPGEETVFTLTLKLGNSHFSDEQLEELPINEAAVVKTDAFLITEQEQLEAEPLRERIKGAKMLIVEDNDSLREMLAGLFEPYYEVLTAADGEEGLQKGREEQPDIILSDVVMPRMTGTKLCKEIKSDFATCHIPVVLLTARTAIEHTLEGLRTGADDYITKPFHTSLLISRCNNLVNSRRILQEKFSKQPQAPARILATNPMDEDLLERTMEIIERNMDNAEFSLSELIRELCMSRTYFFQKIKGITGQTPNEFLSTVRLKRAAFLLRSDLTLSISEISDKTGFSSPRYFGRCFKEAYGVSPLGYRNNKGKEDEEQGEKDKE